MTEGIPLASRMGAGISDPRVARIPEGWFLMGSETGQDNERPVHRVWIDAFELAVCQVTNAEYTQYSSPKPEIARHFIGAIPIFHTRNKRWSVFRGLTPLRIPSG